MRKPVVSNVTTVVVVLSAFILGATLTDGIKISRSVEKRLNTKPAQVKLVQNKGFGEKVISRGAISGESRRQKEEVTEAGNDAPVEYIVKTGDSLFLIANKFGTSIDSIIYLNNLKSERLDIDQKLKVPRKKLTLPNDYQSIIQKDEKLIESLSEEKRTTETKIVKKSVQVPERKKFSRGQSSQKVQMLAWTEANDWFNGVATVTDVETGRTFKVRRNGGHNHADAVPLTIEDTIILKRLYGGKWSWDRRAIVLEINGRSVAASMNGMPHGDTIISGNNFPGHFCIHFLGSKTHGSEYTKSRRPKLDPEHQAMIHRAAQS